MRILIEREHYGDKQTLGTLYLYDGPRLVYKCKTLELPWKNNQRNVSCIPKGTYKARIVPNSPSFNYTHIDVLDVPNRTFIKIHRGNFYHQILGCILVGTEWRDIDGDGLLDVVSSKEALDNILELSNEEIESIQIRDRNITL
jgi:hypothetical protein